MSPGADAPRVLVVGGLGGFLGRALAEELVAHYQVRSVHRSVVPQETSLGVEWIPGDAAGPTGWPKLLERVDAVVNLAWYRTGSAGKFARLQEGLERLVSAARDSGVGRFVQVSVPPAPERLESRLPYLRSKRAVDHAIASAGVSYRILRPTAMFGPEDVLLGVMMRSMERYPRFPMFGEGGYHLSPIAVSDVAHAIVREIAGSTNGTVDLGGPRRFSYQELTDLMYALLDKTPRYWRMSPANGRRLAWLLQSLGSSLLYAYEVEWLVSDRLGLAPYGELGRSLTPVEPYLRSVADRLIASRRGSVRPIAGQA